MSTKPLRQLRFLGYIVINSIGRLYRDLLSADLHVEQGMAK